MQTEVIKALLNALSDDEKEVVCLVIKEERPLSEVAALTGRSIEEVTELESAALRRLRHPRALLQDTAPPLAVVLH